MSNPIGTLTLFKRETFRFLKVWQQTLLAPVISNLLYFAIFGLSLQRSVETLGDVSYLAFLAPGLIIMGIINNSFQNPSSSIIIMKYQGLITDLMVVPLKRRELLLAFISSAVLRGLIVGGMTFATAIFFVDFTYDSVPIIILTSILVALFFSFVGLSVGIWADEFDRTAFIQNFVLLPLIFLGGVFYPSSSLPGVFAQISAFNPIVHMINLLRYGFTGMLEYPVSLSLSVLAGGTALAGFIAYYLLKSGYKLQN
jgi:ABC-2 type transport system permease protein